MRICLFCEVLKARYLVVSFVALTVLLGLSHKAHAERIITIDGSLTEIVYALGSEKELVGRDVTSTYPAEVLTLPSVGYMRQLSVEGILSLDPTLVITTTDAKPQKVFDQLEEAGVKVVRLTNTFTVDGVYNKIEKIGQLLNKSDQASLLIREVKNQIADAQTLATKMSANQMRTAIFTMGMRGGNMLVAGSNTRADEMLRLAGVKNAPADLIEGYKPLTAESAILYNPDHIITMEHGLQASGGKQKVLNSTAISMTNAGKHQNLIVMKNSFLNFGPRIGEEIIKLANEVYGQHQAGLSIKLSTP